LACVKRADMRRFRASLSARGWWQRAAGGAAGNSPAAHVLPSSVTVQFTAPILTVVGAMLKVVPSTTTPNDAVEADPACRACQDSVTVPFTMSGET
jgi:hypothetical protein